MSDCAQTSSHNILKLRSRFTSALRSFFCDQDFLEIDTPKLVINPGLEPSFELFETVFSPSMGGPSPRQDYYLITSPEYHLKKALSTGLSKIFEITSSFRNGEWSVRHRPEFLMLEWYRHPGNYKEIANDVEDLLAHVAQKFCTESSLKMRFEKGRAQHFTVCEAFEKFAHLDLKSYLAPKKLNSFAAYAHKQGFASVNTNDSFEDAFHKILLESIEPALEKMDVVFLWDYPAPLAVLSRPSQTTPYVCERFEVYFAGVELANAFGELTDADEQRRRCKEDQQQRITRYGKTPPLDEEFLESLRQLKPCAGIALGVERLLMVLTGSKNLSDVRVW